MAKKRQGNFLGRIFRGGDSDEEIRDKKNLPEETDQAMEERAAAIEETAEPPPDKEKKRKAKSGKTYTEFRYLEQLVKYRLDDYFPARGHNKKPDLPPFEEWSLIVPPFIKEHIEDSPDTFYTESLATIIMLAIVPHVYPDLLDTTIKEMIGDNGDFQKIGGVRGRNFRGFIPTCQTALFLLAHDDLDAQFRVMKLFDSDAFLNKNQLVIIDDPPMGEPLSSGMLVMPSDYVDLLATGKQSRPHFGMNFPAKLLETPLEWSDLVLPAETMAQIKDLEIWLKHHKKLGEKWKIGKKIKSGYRVLFHGPPGTGKTMTASLLGILANKDVYKIDLALVISKYIGETEKNLGRLFDKANNKDWILFFDEADALFGKRTQIRDAHDKYANQEVSYLLQRFDDYPGLIIAASNFKTNLDEAFARRFQNFIYFPPPQYHDRMKLWQNYLPKNGKELHNINIPGIAKKYNLNGGNIVNVVQYACLHSLEKEQDTLEEKDILNGIRREYLKEGRIIKNQ